MNLFSYLAAVVRAAVEELSRDGVLPSGLDLSRIGVEAPRDPSHGDVATNAAMVLAKPAGKNPRQVAEALAEKLRGSADVVSAEVAGPGFLNLRLTPEFWRARLVDIVSAGPRYGDSKVGIGERVNVEYVSANPTGPLTAGHARGAVVGDALAGLLAKAGYDVTREYYINDAGAQVDVLARSAYLRYREAFGEAVEIPSGLYPGEYLKSVGAKLKARDGDKWMTADEAVWLPVVRPFAIDALMDMIRDDLVALGVKMDRFSSERALVEAGKVQEALATLDSKGLLYKGVLEPPKGKLPDDWEPREQLLFRATQFGDDVDRPIAKADGSFTYFANDVAYHLDKWSRGFNNLIDVVGADHAGWVKRITAAVAAISDGKAAIDVKLCQLVNLLQGGVPVKMSKRSGNFVTLRDLIDEVGKDVVRFVMLTRRNDQTLDFDYDKVVEQSKDNPVFYVQYAHARCRSVLRHAAALPEPPNEAELASADYARLTEDELPLIRAMAQFPNVIEQAAIAHEPHRIAFYLYELAGEFHSLWNKGRDDATLRFLIESDPALTLARVGLVKAVQTVLASGLGTIGVEPVEELRA
ncbi:arginine--tRNA ligase [Roseiterribacter gracilis]|uniref:Arginine--tRNA ligase n=1 Tax=Roseiterribacter gracilis TaxID=2812848 RepID=A0A8S8X909_9PROT|nr:arginine--tRNA ligase [Rhodospirillales bacterium TMPK1]